jgi:hypothetical protein
VLGGNEAVNLKDLQRPQENVMKESVTENRKLTLIDCGFKGVSETFLNKIRKRTSKLRCYSNNAKKQTSKGLGSQVCCGETQQKFLMVSIGLPDGTSNYDMQ